MHWRRGKAPLGVLAALIAFACVSVATADVIVLTEGSRLNGKIDRLADGKLTVITDFAGTLQIDASLVESIETDRPLVVGLESGDRLIGPISSLPDNEGALVQTQMGGIPVNVDKIQAIWSKDGKSPEALAMEAEVAKIRAEMAAKEPKWTGSIDAGIFYKQGNKEVVNALGHAEVRRQTDDDLLRFWALGNYSKESKVRNVAEAKGGAYYEYSFTRRWFAFGSTEFEYDEFENLNLRAILSGGAGYYWLRRPDQELKTRGGVAFMHESFMDDQQTNTGMLDLGVDYRLDLAPWLQFKQSVTYYPTCRSTRDYRLVSDSAFLIPLANSDVWKLKLGASYEYDSLPPPGVDRLDETYYANILYEIK